MIGIVGFDARFMSLRELHWAAEAKRREEWERVAVVSGNKPLLDQLRGIIPPEEVRERIRMAKAARESKKGAPR